MASNERIRYSFLVSPKGSSDSDEKSLEKEQSIDLCSQCENNNNMAIIKVPSVKENETKCEAVLNLNQNNTKCTHNQK